MTCRTQARNSVWMSAHPSIHLSVHLSSLEGAWIILSQPIGDLSQPLSLRGLSQPLGGLGQPESVLRAACICLWALSCQRHIDGHPMDIRIEYSPMFYKTSSIFGPLPNGVYEKGQPKKGFSGTRILAQWIVHCVLKDEIYWNLVRCIDRKCMQWSENFHLNYSFWNL